jgi:hypothetical protein
LAKPPRVGVGVAKRAAKNAVGEPEAERRRGGQTPDAVGATGRVPSGGATWTLEASGQAGRVAGPESGRVCG